MIKIYFELGTVKRLKHITKQCRYASHPARSHSYSSGSLLRDRKNTWRLKGVELQKSMGSKFWFTLPARA